MELRKALEKDIIDGNGTLTQIAEKNNTEYGDALSVLGSLRVMGIVERVGVLKTDNEGQRLSEGISPVKTFNINDLSDKELKEKGLERFIKG
jgi:hypothetical protein